MCGINGIFSPHITNHSQRIEQMNAQLAHRGPNDSGVFIEGNLTMGHRRLSIIDLSSAGHQPMVSDCGRYVIVYNGELYNYKELKSQINYPFITHSDTEVVLAAWKKMGEQALQLFKGMFAFAIWDKMEQTLTLVRDRLGIKPLYYFTKDNEFVFSSELRALLKSDIPPRTISRDSLVDYLRYQTVQAPNTMINDVMMLLPGHLLTLQTKSHAISIKKYWDLFNTPSSPPPSDYNEVKNTVRKLFFEAVEKRLIADVPFGGFLSGGIDSSAVVGAMAQISSTPINTFNISFAEEEFSEAKYARYIAKLHNTHHHEIHLTPNDFLEMLPNALVSMDHPSGDGGNSWLVSIVTKEAGIDMALSGLGGDELFAGYSIFNRMVALDQRQWLWNTPSSLRNLAGKALTKLKPSVSSSKIAQLLSLPNYDFNTVFAVSRQALLDTQINSLLNRAKLPSHAPVDWLTTNMPVRNIGALSKTSMAEMSTYMQNVLLRDTDQMSMAHALEVRVPFLDHDLVEYVLSLPDKYKHPITPKKLLVDSFPELLPDYIVNRPKMGFTFPWREWLKNELHSYADERIKTISHRNYFNQQEILKLWSQFLAGNPNVTFSRIWPLIVLEEWMQRNEIE